MNKINSFLFYLFAPLALLAEQKSQNEQDSLYNLSFRFYDQREYTNGSEVAQRLVQYAQEKGNEEALALGLRAYGVGLHLLGEIDSALSTLSDARDLALAQGMDDLYSKSAVQIASLYRFSGKNSDAIREQMNLLRSEKLSPYMNLYVQKELSKSYYYIGGFEKSMSYADEVISELETKDSLSYSELLVLGEVLNTKAICMLEQKPKAAEKTLLKLIELTNSQLKDSTMLMVAKSNLAEYYSRTQQKIQETLELQQECIDYYKRKEGSKFNIPPLLSNKANTLFELNRKEEALQCLYKALPLSTELKQFQYLSNGYKKKAEILSSLGRYDSVYYFMNKASQMSDSLYKQELNEQNARLSMEFDFEKEYALNEKLRKINESQQKVMNTQRRLNWVLIAFAAVILLAGIKFYIDKRKNKRLAQSLEKKKAVIEGMSSKKDQVLSIISHDLRAPINQLIYLQQEYEQLDDDMRQKMSKSILESTKNGLYMLDNMLHWANGFIKNEFVQSEFQTYKEIDTVFKQLQDQAERKGISLLNDSDNFKVKSDKQLFNIIIRNLVNNAIKYSPEGSEVKVESEKTATNLVFRVKDHGEGIAESVFKEINDAKNVRVSSRKGTQGESGAGIGLKLSMDFARKMGGKLYVESTTSEGTIMAFELSLKNAGLS